MTPAIDLIKKNKIKFTLHRYTPGCSEESYGEEAALALNIPSDRIFKTLVTELNNDPTKLAVAFVPVNKQLDLKLFAQETGAKKVQMTTPANAEKATGYVVGGISPLGQKKNLSVILDCSIQNFETIYFSAGKRGLQIEMTPRDLVKLAKGKVAVISR
ncbi:Cys-tRNA(Pro) deacylase [bacterium]|nr:Cys-tRNA(Pro) deacylase [bacterium]